MATSYSSRDWSRGNVYSARPVSLGHAMTRHVAAAVVVFAILQIWLVNAAIGAGAPRIVSAVALLVLMALAIPLARRAERRWYGLAQQALPSPTLTARFRRDIRRVWGFALLVPVCWISAALFFAPAAIAAN